MTDHTPIPCVTIDSLRLNHLSLSRLLDDVSRRLRDMLAAEYGVAVGDTVQYPPSGDSEDLFHIQVTSLSMAIERVEPNAEKPGGVVLIVRGQKEPGSALEYSFRWNPETCRVIKKGEPG